MRSTLSRLAQCGVKDFLRFARIAQHQETKAIELRKLLFSIRHARWSPKKLRALYACRPTQAILPACIRFVNELPSLGALQGFQPSRYFLGIFPAVERRDAKIAFPLCAETDARCDDYVQLAQHSIEHFPAR